jgi:hypothetical protein
MMNLEIPEGANVHIFIGKAPPLALTDQRAEVVERSRGRGLLGRALKVALVGVLVIGGFWIGEQRSQTATADTGFAAPPPVSDAFPSQAGVASQAAGQPPAPDSGQVPSSFQAQLQQPPSVQPPPGQNSGSGNNAANAFGLSN